MSDLVAAIGLIFAIEGIIFTAFPLGAKRAMAATLDTRYPAAHCRIGGRHYRRDDRLAGPAMRKARTSSAGALPSP
jgi:uncharacterized protein YjeT (DUF2065 family)